MIGLNMGRFREVHPPAPHQQTLSLTVGLIPFFLFPFCPAMEELIVELRLFLELLDHEYLTSTVREKKAVLTNILLRLQSSKGESHRLLGILHPDS